MNRIRRSSCAWGRLRESSLTWRNISRVRWTRSSEEKLRASQSSVLRTCKTPHRKKKWIKTWCVCVNRATSPRRKQHPLPRGISFGALLACLVHGACKREGTNRATSINHYIACKSDLSAPVKCFLVSVWPHYGNDVLVFPRYIQQWLFFLRLILVFFVLVKKPSKPDTPIRHWVFFCCVLVSPEDEEQKVMQLVLAALKLGGVCARWALRAVPQVVIAALVRSSRTNRSQVTPP